MPPSSDISLPASSFNPLQEPAATVKERPSEDFRKLNMFGRSAFHSWIHIVIGACVFALMFGFMVASGEALFDGYVQPSRASVGLGAGAFLGYIAVAVLVRRDARV